MQPTVSVSQPVKSVSSFSLLQRLASGVKTLLIFVLMIVLTGMLFYKSQAEIYADSRVSSIQQELAITRQELEIAKKELAQCKHENRPVSEKVRDWVVSFKSHE
jgi:hypothetical protein